MGDLQLPLTSAGAFNQLLGDGMNLCAGLQWEQSSKFTRNMNASIALTLQEEIPTHGAAQQKRENLNPYLNREDCQAGLVLMDCRDFQLIEIDLSTLEIFPVDKVLNEGRVPQQRASIYLQVTTSSWANHHTVLIRAAVVTPGPVHRNASMKDEGTEPISKPNHISIPLLLFP